MDYKHRYIQSNVSKHDLLSCVCGYTIRNLKPIHIGFLVIPLNCVVWHRVTNDKRKYAFRHF